MQSPEFELSSLLGSPKRSLQRNKCKPKSENKEPKRVLKRKPKDVVEAVKPKRVLRRGADVAEKTVNTKMAVHSTSDSRAAELERLKMEAEGVLEKMPAMNNEDAEQLEQYRHMFEKLVTIATILEDNITGKKNGREVYPLMQTYNQIREVIADMRALRDVGAMGSLINDEVLAPLMQSIAQDTVDLYQGIVKLLSTHLGQDGAAAMTPKIDQLFASAGSTMHRSYENALDKSQKVLGG